MPRDYMDRLLREANKQGTRQPIIDALRHACIPVPDRLDDFGAQFEQTQVKQFLEERAVLILEMLGSLLGDALQRAPRGDIDDGEADD